MPPASALALLFLALFVFSQVCYANFDLPSKSLLSDQQLDRDALVKEIENAQIQLSSLEKNLLEKDADLFDKERIISSLKDKLHAIQEGGSKEVEAMLDRTKQKSKQLAKKAAELEEALNEKGIELSTLKERAQMLEAAGKGHMSQHEEMEKVLRDQKQRTDVLEKSLQEAREAVRQAAARYDAKNKELREAHIQWLPLWASKHVSHLQASLSNQWSTHGRPLFDPVIGRVSKLITVIQKWTKRRFQALRMNAEQIQRTVLKQWWKMAHLKVASHVAIFKEKAIEGFEVSKAFSSPLLKKTQNYIENTIQVARNSSSPYMDKASAVFQPYFNQVQVFCKPYTAKVTKSYNKYVKYATKYHLQLQSKVRKALKKSKYLASIASKELVWFLASALLIMPLYGVLMLLSVIFGDRKQSTYAKGAGSHRHRKVRHSKQFNK